MNSNKEKKKPSNENPFLADEGWELIQDTGGHSIDLFVVYSPNAFDK